MPFELFAIIVFFGIPVIALEGSFVWAITGNILLAIIFSCFLFTILFLMYATHPEFGFIEVPEQLVDHLRGK